MFTSPLLVFVLVASYADALSGLARIQEPMPGFKAELLTGEWFTTFRKPPCSFKGSEEFVNIRLHFSLDGKNGILSRGTWGIPGTKYCNIAYANLVFTKIPGVINYKDSFGNALSGRLVVIGTDYKTFGCHWVCTKFSVFGDRCEDPAIFVNTRVPRPSKKVIARVNALLMKRFGISINYLDKVFHNGCKFTSRYS